MAAGPDLGGPRVGETFWQRLLRGTRRLRHQPDRRLPQLDPHKAGPLARIEAPGQPLYPLQPQAFLTDTFPLHGFRPADLVALANEPVETAGHRVDEKAVESIVGIKRIDNINLRLSELFLLALQPNELLLGELMQSFLHALYPFHLAQPVVHARYPFTSQVENAVLKWVMKSPTVK